MDGRGSITVPRPIVDQFGLRAGDTCAFTLLAGGRLRLRFFRRVDKRRWRNLLTREVVRRLPDWRERPEVRPPGTSQ